MNEPTIQRLAETMLTETGARYQVARQALMSYVHRLSNEDFASEVERITNPQIMGQIWSIGLSLPKQQILTRKWEEFAE